MTLMKIIGIEYEMPLVLDLEIEVEAPAEGFSGSLEINHAWASFGEDEVELPPVIVRVLNTDEDFRSHLWDMWTEEQEELQRIACCKKDTYLSPAQHKLLTHYERKLWEKGISGEEQQARLNAFVEHHFL